MAHQQQQPPAKQRKSLGRRIWGRVTAVPKKICECACEIFDF